MKSAEASTLHVAPSMKSVETSTSQVDPSINTFNSQVNLFISNSCVVCTSCKGMIILSRRKNHLFKKIISRIITIAALSVFVYAGHGLFDIFMDYYKNRQLLNDLQETFYDSNATFAEESPTNDQGTNPFNIRPGFDELLKQNEDVVGWITVDGTQIDYPILQAEDNVKYLNRNFYHEESRAGSIFLDYRNDIQLDDERNIVVYGHRMKDGSMFQH